MPYCRYVTLVLPTLLLFPGLFTGRVRPCGSGRGGAGESAARVSRRLDPTRPDPREFRDVLTRPDPTP